MKTLVIHPTDPTTDVLKKVYEGINAEVITDTRDDKLIYDKIANADRTICLGHGMPTGLIGTNFRVCVDDRHVELLRKQKDNVYIWCYATNFLVEYGLSGFASGMFISEPKEAYILNVQFSGTELEDSNLLFASIVNRGVINGDTSEQIAEDALKYYAGINPVTRYNRPLFASVRDGVKTMNEAILMDRMKSMEVAA